MFLRIDKLQVELPRPSEADTGEEREVVDGIPEGGEVPDLTPVPEMFAPNVSPEEIDEIAKKLD